MCLSTQHRALCHHLPDKHPGRKKRGQIQRRYYFRNSCRTHSFASWHQCRQNRNQRCVCCSKFQRFGIGYHRGQATKEYQMGNLHRKHYCSLLWHASSIPCVHMLAHQDHSNHRCHHRCQRSRKFHHCLCQMACLYSIWSWLDKIVPQYLSIGRHRHQGLQLGLQNNLK